MPPGALDIGGPPVRSVNPTMRAMALAIPGFLALSVGYVLYLVGDYVLMKQFYHTYHEHGFALGLLIPYVVVAALVVASYGRTFVTVRNNPGTVPLGPAYARNFYGVKPTRAKAGANGTGRGFCSFGARAARERRGSISLDSNRPSTTAKTAAILAQGGQAPADDLEAGLARSVPYESTTGVGFGGGPGPAGTDPRLDPDSPGLELFYTKDVFECGDDGRPVWCSQCGTWKPDRAHHCSEVNRCVRKMDHYCPWVGGIVSETSFKFFLQFTSYTTVLCALTLGICGYALKRRKGRGEGADARIIVGLALAGFFGLFASAMASTCFNFALANTTAVEAHQLKKRVKLMAVRVQRGAPPIEGKYSVVTYPLPKGDSPPGYGTLSSVVQPPLAATGGEETDPDPLKASREARAARRAAARDRLAFRTFAVIPVPMGMNVWDLGWWRNWNSVMGTNVLDWLLPVRSSPCCDHDSMHSFYAMNPKFKKICDSLDLPACQELEEAPNW